MLIKLSAYSILGLQAFPVEVEIDAGVGLPSITLVGLPDQTVKESRERVRTAIHNSGFKLPSKRFIVNLAPADLRKEGGSFDLAIAAGILAACGHVPNNRLDAYVFLGELALDGTLRAIPGLLPIARALTRSTKHIVIPPGNAAEARLVNGVRFSTCKSLFDLARHLQGEFPLTPLDALPLTSAPAQNALDFSEVQGQYIAKRAIEVAVAGNHHVLLVGPPGAGKTMLAQRVPAVLPPLTEAQALDSASIHSVAGLDFSSILHLQRPYRAPHHTISHAALAGGGAAPRPGEVSLAHNGLLFLDEFPEFKRDALESLREPLEEGAIRIARAKHTLQYPARFLLIAAMNPCPCGYLTDAQHECRCNATQIQKYLAKLSGPLLDRIDLHIDIPAVPVEALQKPAQAESSSAIQSRILQARALQLERYREIQIETNAQLHGRALHTYCVMTSSAAAMMAAAIREFRFSARTYAKLLKVARTIADLDAANRIHERHIAEAIQYRGLDRQLWS